MKVSENIKPDCMVCHGKGRVAAGMFRVGDSESTSCPACDLRGAIAKGRGHMAVMEGFKYEQPSVGHKAYLVFDGPGGTPRLCLAGYEWAERQRAAGSSVIEPLYTAENARAAVAAALQYRGDDFERAQFESVYLLPGHLYFSKRHGRYRTMGDTAFARDCADDATERLFVWLKCARHHTTPEIIKPEPIDNQEQH